MHHKDFENGHVNYNFDLSGDLLFVVNGVEVSIPGSVVVELVTEAEQSEIAE